MSIERKAALRTSAHGTIPIGWMLLAAGLGGAIVLRMLISDSLTLYLEPGWMLAAGLYLATAGTMPYRFRKPTCERHRMCRDGAEYLSLFAFLCLTGVIATYPVAARSTGFVDAPLQRIDMALGFDWLAWYRFIAEHAWIQPIERAAYHCLFVTPAILLGYFAWSDAMADARRFIASFWFATCITLCVFPFMPARGPLATLWHGTLPYVPVSAQFQSRDIVALRDHALSRVDVGDLSGLVGAPSFHTASAVLFIVAAWPHRPLRWPVLAINLAMLVAIPVEGTHYLIDMILGAVVAGIAIGVTQVLTRRLPRTRRPFDSALPPILRAWFSPAAAARPRS